LVRRVKPTAMRDDCVVKFLKGFKQGLELKIFKPLLLSPCSFMLSSYGRSSYGGHGDAAAQAAEKKL
jgi:hypothetical protein